MVGFSVEGYELPILRRLKRLRQGLTAVYGGQRRGSCFTALTDTRFYGLNYNIPSLCFGAAVRRCTVLMKVDLDSLRKSTKATALFIAEWCGWRRFSRAPAAGRFCAVGPNSSDVADLNQRCAASR